MEHACHRTDGIAGFDISFKELKEVTPEGSKQDGLTFDGEVVM